MRRGVDYHIHLFYQRCANETMTLANVLRKAEEHKMSRLAITDHVNNLGMLENMRNIKRDIEQAETEIELLFGVELNYQGCDGAFAWSPAIREQYGFEIAIGGIHSDYTDSDDPTDVIDIQHRHHMRTLADPTVEILVHPYWFPTGQMRKRADAWWESLLRDFPEERIRELADASRTHNSAIEVNAAATLRNPNVSPGIVAAYIEWLARMRDAGALFAAGSDAHDISQFGATQYIEGLLEGLGVPDAQIWEPCR